MNVFPGPAGVHPFVAALLSHLHGVVPNIQAPHTGLPAAHPFPNQLQANDTPATGSQPVMMYQNGQPVYYGTPEAKAAALRGLQNVAAVHGTKGPQWNSAVQAALGVLGPDFQASQDSFSPAALNQVRGRQGQSSALRDALAARLALGGSL